MSERSDEGEARRAGPRESEPVRDFEPGGDVGEGSHGAFAHVDEERVHRNEERLGERGRPTTRDESGLLEDIERDRAASHQHDGPGEVRGLEEPGKDDVGA
jgi:hypothetical protein